MDYKDNKKVNAARFWMTITTIILVIILYTAISSLRYDVENGQKTNCLEQLK